MSVELIKRLILGLKNKYTLQQNNILIISNYKPTVNNCFSHKKTTV